jgi:hypothetical protein
MLALARTITRQHGPSRWKKSGDWSIGCCAVRVRFGVAAADEFPFSRASGRGTRSETVAHNKVAARAPRSPPRGCSFIHWPKTSPTSSAPRRCPGDQPLIDNNAARQVGEDQRQDCPTRPLHQVSDGRGAGRAELFQQTPAVIWYILSPQLQGIGECLFTRDKAGGGSVVLWKSR